MEDSAGHDRTVLDARSGSVPLYHPLGSGTAVHLSLRESDFSFQFLFQTLDSSFGFSHFFSTITDAVAFRQQTLQLVQLHVLNFSDLPVQRAAFGDQTGLKGSGIIANNSPSLGQMHFKACAFAPCCILWACAG